MAKFKIGDRVRVLPIYGEGLYQDFPSTLVGELGTICVLADPYTYHEVFMDVYGHEELDTFGIGLFTEDELELAE